MINSTVQIINARYAGTDRVYFRDNIIVEPMLYGWHAWAHLIPPLQHAMNIAFRHIPIMKSYIAAPSVHIKAASNPAMAGGPYIDTPLSNMNAVKSLLATTTEMCAPLIKLANDYVALAGFLRETAKGYSLEEAYGKIPDSLKGSVELFYDPSDSPNIKVLEETLFRRGMNHGLQEFYVRPVDEDMRKFFISNPRIGTGDGIVLTLPFNDERVDILARARTSGVSYDEIEPLIAMGRGGIIDIDTILTSENPSDSAHVSKATRIAGEQMRIRYFGHACVLLETSDTCILIDPVVAWTPNRDDSRFTYYDLPEKIDYVIISHAHHDHFYIETLLQLRHKIGTIIVPPNNGGCIMDPSMKSVLKGLGFENIIVFDMFDEIRVSGGSIMSLPSLGEHADLGIFSKQSIYVELNGKKLLFMVDSNALDLSLYTELRDLTGQIDAVFIGMECHGAPLSWLYGPLMATSISRKNDESRRLCSSKSERAAEVVEIIGAEHVFIYAMGHEPFVGHLTGLVYDEASFQVNEAMKLTEICRNNGKCVEYLNGSKDLFLDT